MNSPAHNAPSRPNVLVIVTDQQRYDCLGYARLREVTTPNLDRLAAEGAWFEHAFTPTPLCCPARQAFLTGSRPERFGSLWNYDQGLPAAAPEPGCFTWPEALRQAGYRTGYLGKWHVHPTASPRDFGYDDYVDDAGHATYVAKNFPGLTYREEFLGEPDPLPSSDAHPAWLTDQAILLLKEYEATQRPWHLRLDFREPHLPSRPAGRFAGLYDPASIPPWGSFGDPLTDKPYIQRQQLLNWGVADWTWEEWAPVAARYFGIISQVDSEIGRLLDALDQLGRAENTLVCYTTDHGDMGGAHGMMDKHFVMYEDLVRVPLIARWPHVIPPGQKRAEFTCHFLDLVPTLLEAAGVSPPTELDGRSLMPLLRDEPVEDWPTQVMASYNGQQFGLYTQRMLRDETWKYVWNTVDIDELYHLQDDPYELHNRVHDNGCQDQLADIRKRLHDELVRCGDPLAQHWLTPQLLEGRVL